jgi:Amt family ammonium transporter
VTSNASDAEASSYVVREGLLYGGGFDQLLAQAGGAAIVSVWSFTVALLVGLAVRAAGLLRVKAEAEIDGIDIAEHKETAYDFSTGSGGGGGGAFAQAGIGVGGTAVAPAESKPAQTANV